MARVGAVAERLRAFVRERARKDGRLYERGNATRLARALGIDAPWVTGYVDNPPTRHADVDQALAICAFYGINLADFQKSRAPRVAAPPAKQDPMLAGMAEALPGMSADDRVYLLGILDSIRARLGMPPIESQRERARAARR